VSVYGADQPGIVFRVAERLAALDVNITDLTSRVIGPSDDPVYALMLEVSTTDATAVERELSSLHEELGVDVSVHPLETDLL
jgi:glycine cleavage system transcriptional repressor